MSQNSTNSSENQEIDLTIISRKINGIFDSFSNSIFRGFLFLKRNILIIGVLFLIGAGLGIYMDKNTNIYDNEIIVSPNFGSVDYMYSKINQIESKIKEGDTVFLRDIVGLKNPKKLKDISIEPITDVYKFIDHNEANFDLIKLMAEDGDIKKIIEDKVTSKNYPYHIISFTTDNLTDDEKTVKPLLDFLNNNDYFKKVQQVSLKNIEVKLTQNDSIISQINGLLNSFSKSANGEKNNNLVYYNENTQLNDVIKTKDQLINEQAMHRLELISMDKIVKDNTVTINIKNVEATNGKMKFIIPFVFVGLFLLAGFLRSYYRRQMAKLA